MIVDPPVVTQDYNNKHVMTADLTFVFSRKLKLSATFFRSVRDAEG